MKSDGIYTYLPDGASFTSQDAMKFRLLYAPLCGTDASSLKSSISPFLGGDIKTDKLHYLTKPVSREDLRAGTRNFYVKFDDGRVVSFAQAASPDERSNVEIGQLWHKVTRRFDDCGIAIEALNFIPVSGEKIELMKVRVTNVSEKDIRVSPTAFVPIFARALANKHDHEHVTALLHRIEQIEEGVIVKPAMSFNEEGHKDNGASYFVVGISSDGEEPDGTFPTIESFYGEEGTLFFPEAVMKDKNPVLLSKIQMDGKEAAGGLKFRTEIIPKSVSKEYIIVMGMVNKDEEIETIVHKFCTTAGFYVALAANNAFWKDKSRSIEFTTGDKDFNAWTKWVMIQPLLRRIFGCSFLPDHDYGKGGKGWRDIWQDLLSLILIEPEHVKENLINNFGGVRIDGSNATIIGSKPGEFIADRNSITRVWMDHGVWPFSTTLLYINQTGDLGILDKLVPYFRDMQLSRSAEKDISWSQQYGNKLKDKKGKVYEGTILEHILVQHLVQFFNVGEHNITRLESADWNDGLDMAKERGESVAFMSFYAGNLSDLADMIETACTGKRAKAIEIARELVLLLDSIKGKPKYDNITYKKNLLAKYFKSVGPEISGKKTKIDAVRISKDLRTKSAWIFAHIKKNERVTVKENAEKYVWFNGYYDNRGKRVEGKHGDIVKMTLTGQVFPIMSGLAGAEDIAGVVKSVRRYLKDGRLGGVRLNTDLGTRNYLDLGRAFGFAYGTKENGAIFSHMAIMYAFALYKRGFAHEGRDVLKSIYDMCADSSRSKIYPGIPEYFDSEGRGMYHYLTGSASWMVLLLLTQVFGARGQYGDLVIAPKLSKNEFSFDRKAGVIFNFAGKKINVEYSNPGMLDYPEYRVSGVNVNGKETAPDPNDPMQVIIKREIIEKTKGPTEIKLTLAAK